MDTKIDLKKYEDMYDTFDGDHDKRHLEEVRTSALELAKIYLPEKQEIVYVAATLHDIGLSVSRDDHERHGYEIMLKDEELKNGYSAEECSEILEAVKEHRASTGNPVSMVARIVSDADKVADNSNRAMTRAYEWGVKHLPSINHDGQLLRAAYHLHEKFGKNGSGTRLYFKESVEKQNIIYAPIFEALRHYQLDELNSFLDIK